VVHLSRDQFASLFGVFANADVDENAVDDAPDDSLVVAPAASGNPANLLAVKDAEVGFVGAEAFTGRRERRPYPLSRSAGSMREDNTSKVTLSCFGIPHSSKASASRVI